MIEKLVIFPWQPYLLPEIVEALVSGDGRPANRRRPPQIEPCISVGNWGSLGYSAPNDRHGPTTNLTRLPFPSARGHDDERCIILISAFTKYEPQRSFLYKLLTVLSESRGNHIELIV